MLSDSKFFQPKTDHPPAKVKDPAIIEMVMAGNAAYNAKSGELLFLPQAQKAWRTLSGELMGAFCDIAAFQPVDCGSDEALFSLAERYVREWGTLATAFAEERGRNIVLRAWHPDAAHAEKTCADAQRALTAHLPGTARLSFVEELDPTCERKYTALSPAEPGALHAREAFCCDACGALYLPDSPCVFSDTQPDADEAAEPLLDIETPGANTIAELCAQLGVDIRYTLKAMLYVAYDDKNSPHPVAAFLRGDRGVGMGKLAFWLKRERDLHGLRTAEKTELYEMIGEVAGYCGPVGLPEHVVVVCDRSVEGARNTVVGANRPGYHKKGCCHPRDFDFPLADIAQNAEGGRCTCGGTLSQIFARTCAELTYQDVSCPADKNAKRLSYRDKEGANDYFQEIRGNISLEALLLASRF